MDRKYVIAIAVCATVIVVIIVIVVVVVALLIRRRRRVVRYSYSAEKTDECVIYHNTGLGYDERDEEVTLPLTVHQTPCQVLGKGIELALQNQEVMLGDSATFRLRLCDDTDEAGEWTRDDVTLTQSEKTQISINGRDRQLTVTDVHPPDTGEYAYRVGEDMTSAHLSINEAICYRSVLHPPPPPIIPI